ncbi:uncharacterized protein BO87DRAFT_187545 [Aspergillus neoniger CBS 115656]|uniref:Uncharacterized protein n=1 Tax=Aspergillus neoniger (strain CBS 115656) TaxID=1448310 RepID=A0A318YSZ7_ASPNB|nr:hypothetical protein BO87DRAFT_187545 [Aspergillus neoniger CBS 115656]PYH37855.1 hypothetical protein BO87DRAFT_187545 [Aspergillus neoniger CBS 115656]
MQNRPPSQRYPGLRHMGLHGKSIKTRRSQSSHDSIHARRIGVAPRKGLNDRVRTNRKAYTGPIRSI